MTEESTPEEEITYEAEEPSDPRTTGLYGDVDEENSKELVGALIGYINEMRTSPETPLPIELIICTGGGIVSDMFAIYDMMRILREGCRISTVGVGKVMSAGVLLLAAGTKGHRKIGKHCRIMLHHVLTQDQGSIADMRGTYEEAVRMEELMFEAVAAESNLTVEDLREIVKDNTDKFFSAEEALKMGIVDIII